MLDIFWGLFEPKGLVLLVLLAVITSIAYCLRRKARIKETREQKMMHDFMALCLSVFAFSMLASFMIFNAELFFARPIEVRELTSFQDVQQHLHSQFESIESIRKNSLDMNSMLTFFMIVSGAMFPMVAFRLFKHHFGKLKD